MLDLYFFLSFVFIGYIFGQYLEKRHFKSLKAREEKLLNLVTTSSKRPVGEIAPVIKAELVKGSTCVSSDYFKRILANLRKLFGGNVRAYETLLDRARREAILRLKESCPDATQIINLRIETSSVFKGQNKQVGSVEVLAYATALYT